HRLARIQSTCMAERRNGGRGVAERTVCYPVLEPQHPVTGVAAQPRPGPAQRRGGLAASQLERRSERHRRTVERLVVSGERELVKSRRRADHRERTALRERALAEIGAAHDPECDAGECRSSYGRQKPPNAIGARTTACCAKLRRPPAGFERHGGAEERKRRAAQGR